MSVGCTGEEESGVYGGGDEEFWGGNFEGVVIVHVGVCHLM